MSPYRRNVMVGVVVLGAIGILAWMVLKFAGNAIAPFAPARVPIYFISDRADGLGDGSAVTYRGVVIGQVTRVSRTTDDRVRIAAQVDAAPPLPGNLKGMIRSTGLLGGGSSIVLVPVNGNPAGEISANQELSAEYVGLDMLPPEFAELANELRLTARQFRESNVIVHLDEQIQHIGKVLDSVQGLIDDPKLRKDLQDSVANLRMATERANRIGDNLEKFTANLDQVSTETRTTIQETRANIQKTQGHIDDVAKNIGDRLLQIAGLLEQVQQITVKVNEGKGTAGALVNDPKLYESLVDTTQELNATIKDLRRLVQQWEQEGVPLKMGK